MKTITVILTDGSERRITAEGFRVDDKGFLWAGTNAVFSPGRYDGAYETSALAPKQ